jgi:hypothetical protein
MFVRCRLANNGGPQHYFGIKESSCSKMAQNGKTGLKD